MFVNIKHVHICRLSQNRRPANARYRLRTQIKKCVFPAIFSHTSVNMNKKFKESKVDLIQIEFEALSNIFFLLRFLNFL